jgi:hypothetical protein
MHKSDEQKKEETYQQTLFTVRDYENAMDIENAAVAAFGADRHQPPDSDEPHIVDVLSPATVCRWMEVADDQDDERLLRWLQRVYLPTLCGAPLLLVLEWVCCAIRDGDHFLLDWLLETCTTCSPYGCNQARWTPQRVLTSLCVQDDTCGVVVHLTPLHLAATLGFTALLEMVVTREYVSCIRHVSDTHGCNLAQIAVEGKRGVEQTLGFLFGLNPCHCLLGDHYDEDHCTDSLASIAIGVENWSTVGLLVKWKLTRTSEWTNMPANDDADSKHDYKPSLLTCVTGRPCGTRADAIVAMRKIRNLIGLGCASKEHEIGWLCQFMSNSPLGLKEALSHCPDVVHVVTLNVYTRMIKAFQLIYTDAYNNVQQVVQRECTKVMTKRPLFDQCVVHLIASYLSPVYMDTLNSPAPSSR